MARLYLRLNREIARGISGWMELGERDSGQGKIRGGQEKELVGGKALSPRPGFQVILTARLLRLLCRVFGDVALGSFQLAAEAREFRFKARDLFVEMILVLM